MKSQAVKRSVVIAGRKKSISLEDAVWESLTEIAKYRGMTLFSLLATIDSKRKKSKSVVGHSPIPPQLLLRATGRSA
jgi:predicted DNA-binding ribbon-helix-helix protein